MSGTIPAKTLGDVPGMRAFLLAAAVQVGTDVPQGNQHRRLVLVSHGKAGNDSSGHQYDLYKPAGGGEHVRVRVFTFPRLS